MRTRYFIRFALIIGWQAIMAASIFYFSPSPTWLRVIEVSGFLLPFLGYFLAFYRAPAFAGWSRITRPMVLTLSFAIAATVGFFFFVYLMFFLFMVFGTHIGR
jgi:hypothetical protein